MTTINRCLIAIFFLLAFSNFAHATFFDSYAALYTVSSSGSTTADTQFTGDQTPYLYIEFYNNNTNNLSLPPNAFTITNWQDANISNSYKIKQGSNTDQIWVSFSQAYWNTINTPGTWTITSHSPVFADQSYIGSFNGITTFTVLGNNSHHPVNPAPEAKSTILFIIGGGIMALFILRRKKSLNIPLY